MTFLVGEQIVTRKLIYDDRVVCFKHAIRCHEFVSGLSRDAIQCWLMIGRRLGVVRDIRILIAKRLWAAKVEWVMAIGNFDTN
jgi:hypothetical protein